MAPRARRRPTRTFFGSCANSFVLLRLLVSISHTRAMEICSQCQVDASYRVSMRSGFWRHGLQSVCFLGNAKIKTTRLMVHSVHHKSLCYSIVPDPHGGRTKWNGLAAMTKMLVRNLHYSARHAERSGQCRIASAAQAVVLSLWHDVHGWDFVFVGHRRRNERKRVRAHETREL